MENKIIGTYHNRVENIPALKQFCQFIEINQISNFEDAVEEFDKLAKSSFLVDLINFELLKITKENLYTPVSSTYNSICVINTIDYKINLVNIKAKDLLGRKVLTGFFHDKIIASLSKTGIKYSLYNQNNTIQVEVLDKNKKLTLIHKDATLASGESIFISKHKDVFSFEGEENDERISALILTTKPTPSFDWEYDVESMLPIRIVGDQDDCRIEQTCKMLGELGNDSSTNVLKKLVNHPKHNIRWEALRNLMSINYEEGCSSLLKLKNDPHPEVKNAVEKTIDLIKTYNN
jgi:hypothetical protein